MSAEQKKVTFGKPFDKAKGLTAVSNICKYDIEGAETDSRIESKEGILTNGDDIGGSLAEKIWAGFKADKPTAIHLHLKKAYDSLCRFSCSCIQDRENQLVFPAYIDILADGLYVGRMYAPKTERKNHNYVLALPNCVAAKEITFLFPAGSKESFYRMEEIAAFVNDIIPPTSFYGDFDVPFVKEELWEDQSEELENLALHKKLMCRSETGNVHAGNNHSNIEILNDGVSSEGVYCYDGKWVRFFGSSSRLIVIDLGKTSAVSSFETHFLFSDSMWIEIPKVIRFSVSEDGKKWYDAVCFKDLQPTGKESMLPITYTLEKPVKARYVSLYFTCTQNFTDEIIVNGTKSIKNAVPAATLGEPFGIDADDSVIGYLRPDQNLLGGVRDVILLYHNGKVIMDSDFLLPYIAYLDKDGNIRDTMFDGFLFLPEVRALPGGGCPDGGKTFKTDWEGLYDNIFQEGVNMDALEKTAEKVANELHLKDFRLKTYVTIVNIHPEVDNFGEVDGRMLDLSKLEDCKKAVEWYVRKTREKFDSMHYKHLDLCGFYWFSEQLSGVYANIVPAVAEQIHSMGEQFFWIPWFCAPGFTNWKQYGFDVCCMQPNYAFNVGIPEDRLLSNDQLVRKYGLCYEMECWGKLFTDRMFLRKYMNYMKQGALQGYCDAINMYYQDHDDFGRCCHSDDPSIRLMYDYQHAYVKNELPLVPEKPADAEFTAQKNTVLAGSIGNGSPVRSYKLVLSPAHGCVTVSEDGFFTYHPEEGFTGDDAFIYCVNDYLCDSADVTVRITVK